MAGQTYCSDTVLFNITPDYGWQDRRTVVILCYLTSPPDNGWQDRRTVVIMCYVISFPTTKLIRTHSGSIVCSAGVSDVSIIMSIHTLIVVAVVEPSPVITLADKHINRSSSRSA